MPASSVQAWPQGNAAGGGPYPLLSKLPLAALDSSKLDAEGLLVTSAFASTRSAVGSTPVGGVLCGQVQSFRGMSNRVYNGVSADTYTQASNQQQQQQLICHSTAAPVKVPPASSQAPDPAPQQSSHLPPQPQHRNHASDSEEDLPGASPLPPAAGATHAAMPSLALDAMRTGSMALSPRPSAKNLQLRALASSPQPTQPSQPPAAQSPSHERRLRSMPHLSLTTMGRTSVSPGPASPSLPRASIGSAPLATSAAAGTPDGPHASRPTTPSGARTSSCAGGAQQTQTQAAPAPASSLGPSPGQGPATPTGAPPQPAPAPATGALSSPGFATAIMARLLRPTSGALRASKASPASPAGAAAATAPAGAGWCERGVRTGGGHELEPPVGRTLTPQRLSAIGSLSRTASARAQSGRSTSAGRVRGASGRRGSNTALQSPPAGAAAAAAAIASRAPSPLSSEEAAELRQRLGANPDRGEQHQLLLSGDDGEATPSQGSSSAAASLQHQRVQRQAQRAPVSADSMLHSASSVAAAAAPAEGVGRQRACAQAQQQPNRPDAQHQYTPADARAQNSQQRHSAGDVPAPEPDLRPQHLERSEPAPAELPAPPVAPPPALHSLLQHVQQHASSSGVTGGPLLYASSSPSSPAQHQPGRQRSGTGTGWPEPTAGAAATSVWQAAGLPPPVTGTWQAMQAWGGAVITNSTSSSPVQSSNGMTHGSGRATAPPGPAPAPAGQQQHGQGSMPHFQPLLLTHSPGSGVSGSQLHLSPHAGTLPSQHHPHHLHHHNPHAHHPPHLPLGRGLPLRSGVAAAVAFSAAAAAVTGRDSPSTTSRHSLESSPEPASLLPSDWWPAAAAAGAGAGPGPGAGAGAGGTAMLYRSAQSFTEGLMLPQHRPRSALSAGSTAAAATAAAPASATGGYAGGYSNPAGATALAGGGGLRPPPYYIGSKLGGTAGNRATDSNIPLPLSTTGSSGPPAATATAAATAAAAITAAAPASSFFAVTPTRSSSAATAASPGTPQPASAQPPPGYYLSGDCKGEPLQWDDDGPPVLTPRQHHHHHHGGRQAGAPRGTAAQAPAAPRPGTSPGPVLGPKRAPAGAGAAASGAVRAQTWLEGSAALLEAGQAYGRPQLLVHSDIRPCREAGKWLAHAQETSLCSWKSPADAHLASPGYLMGLRAGSGEAEAEYDRHRAAQEAEDRAAREAAAAAAVAAAGAGRAQARVQTWRPRSGRARRRRRRSSSSSSSSDEGSSSEDSSSSDGSGEEEAESSGGEACSGDEGNGGWRTAAPGRRTDASPGKRVGAGLAGTPALPKPGATAVAGNGSAAARRRASATGDSLVVAKAVAAVVQPPRGSPAGWARPAHAMGSAPGRAGQQPRQPPQRRPAGAAHGCSVAEGSDEE